MSPDSFEGKVVVVTGSARGAGRVQAMNFAAEGARVVIADRTDAPRPDLMIMGSVYTVAAEIEAAGGTALPVKVNLSHEDEITALRDKVLSEFGTVDVVVNNAAANLGAKVWEIPVERWDHIMAVNARATFLVTKAFLGEMMTKRSGSIVNISSPCGRGPMPSMSAYSASKAAVDYFTLSIAEELREYGIAVNSVAPSGAIDTEAARQIFSDDEEYIATWEPADHFALGVLWLARQTAESFTGNLVYSRALISQKQLCRKWCCAAIGAHPSIAGPMRVDWEHNTPIVPWVSTSSRVGDEG